MLARRPAGGSIRFARLAAALIGRLAQAPLAPAVGPHGETRLTRTLIEPTCTSSLAVIGFPSPSHSGSESARLRLLTVADSERNIGCLSSGLALINEGTKTSKYCGPARSELQKEINDRSRNCQHQSLNLKTEEGLSARELYSGR
jgi:hypothetical protein